MFKEGDIITCIIEDEFPNKSGRNVYHPGDMAVAGKIGNTAFFIGKDLAYCIDHFRLANPVEVQKYKFHDRIEELCQ